MQCRCLAHICNLFSQRHSGTPKYHKVFCNNLRPNNDILHIQTIKFNFAQLLSRPESKYFRIGFLIIKFQGVSVHSLPDFKKTALNTMHNMVQISPFTFMAMKDFA